MRITVDWLPPLLLVLLPIVVAYNGLGVVGATVAVAVVLGLRHAIMMMDVMGRSKREGLVLETIGLSHYAEKVRWSMELLGIEYREEQDAGIIGVFYAGRMVPGLRVPRYDFTIYNSADILRYLYAKNVNDPAKERFLRPTPEALELEKKIDKMGSDLRQFLYSQMINDPEADANLVRAWGFYADDAVVPKWQKLLLKASMPLLKPFMLRVLNLTLEAGRKSLQQCKSGFLKEADAMLADGRKFLLNTEEPTFVDVAFAAMSAPMFVPDSYCGFKAVNEESRFKMDLVHRKEARDEIAAMRKTPVGKFTLRMYDQLRSKKLGS